MVLGLGIEAACFDGVLPAIDIFDNWLPTAARNDPLDWLITLVHLLVKGIAGYKRKVTGREIDALAAFGAEQHAAVS